MIDDGDIQAALDYAEAVGIDPKTAKLPDVLRRRLDMLMTGGVERTAPAASQPEPEPTPAKSEPVSQPKTEADPFAQYAGKEVAMKVQTEDGEAKRDDANFSHVTAWEYQGATKPPLLHKEPLLYEELQMTTRSYK